MKKIISVILISILICSALALSAAAEEGTVTIDGVTNGTTYEYGTELALDITASSIDATEIKVYLDGAEYATVGPAGGYVPLVNLNAGRHEVYAASVFEDGSADVCDTIEFYYLESVIETVSYDDFEDEATRADNWKPDKISPKIAYEYDEQSDSYCIVSHPGMAHTGVTDILLKPQGTMLSRIPPRFTFEFDANQHVEGDLTKAKVQCKIFVQTDTMANAKEPYTACIGGIPRESHTSYRSSISLGDIGELYKCLENDIWYHVKYVVDIVKGEIELFWAEGKGVDENMTSLGKRIIDPAGSIKVFYWRLEGYGYAGHDLDPILKIDNIHFKEKKTSAYLGKPTYYVEDEVFTDSVPANPTKMVIPFSQAMNEDDINTDNIKLMCDGEEVAVSDVSYNADAKSAELYFAPPLSSNKNYEVVVNKDVTTANGKASPTDLSVSFTTGFNDFDVKSFKAKSGGADVSLDEISSGDRVTMEYTVQNLTEDEVKGVLIFVAYEDDTMVYLDMQPLSVTDNTPDITFTSTSPYAPTASPDLIEAYIWNNMTDGISLLNAINIK